MSVRVSDLYGCLNRPTEEKQKKPKPAPKPKAAKPVKTEVDEGEWTEVSVGARPQVTLLSPCRVGELTLCVGL